MPFWLASPGQGLQAVGVTWTSVSSMWRFVTWAIPPFGISMKDTGLDVSNDRHILL
jgi:hypothetical protein